MRDLYFPLVSHFQKKPVQHLKLLPELSQMTFLCSREIMNAFNFQIRTHIYYSEHTAYRVLVHTELTAVSQPRVKPEFLHMRIAPLKEIMKLLYRLHCISALIPICIQYIVYIFFFLEHS